MQQIFPTKSNLINCKKSLELAKIGYDLMDKKRIILLREMMKLVDEAKVLRTQVDTLYEQAYDAFKRANLNLGNLNKFSKSVKIDEDINIDYRSVMGVEIPRITYSEPKSDVRNFGFNSTNRDFDEACALLCRVKTLTVRLAEVEGSIFRLCDAVSKTQKRSNALSNIVIPKYENVIRYISAELDEKEREEFARLKVIKRTSEE